VAGNETHGYDLAIEFAERAIQDLLQAVFDNGFLAAVLDALPGVNSDSVDVFTINLRFDRPTDVSIPASAADTIDLTVLLGDAGKRGHMRIVVGVDVDRSGDSDAIGLNFADKLFFSDVEVSIAGFPVPGLNSPFRTFLKGFGRLDLLPIPVKRGSTEPTAIAAADVRVIDDTSPADSDAFAGLLTLGGGTAGNRSAFARSFISAGGNAGVAIGFPWLCRAISPLIDSALHLDGAFTNCNLTRTIRIDEKEEVDLTALSIAPRDGFIRVSATVRKTGFCYEASGTVAARILLQIRDGRLVVETQVEDPDVDVSIPWYCWLAAAVVGAIVAGLLFGLIGSILGGILLPLILWLTTEGVEGVVEQAAQAVADAINELSPSVDLPAVGIELIFSDVFIDDIALAGRLRVTDNAPVRAEGTVVVPNGSSVDLDSGKVGSPEQLPGVDLAWLGSGFGRELRAICGARLARTSLASFDEVTRAALYRGPYDASNPMSLAELATWVPFGGILDVLGPDEYKETRRIFGVRTNERRFAAVMATQVTGDFVRLRYRTYEKRLPTLEIIGRFDCSPGLVAERPTVKFVESSALARLAATRLAAVQTGATFEPCVPSSSTPTPSPLSSAMVEGSQAAIEAIPLEQRRIGRWIGTAFARSRGVGGFTASAQGFGMGLRIGWRVNDEGLAGESGSIDAAGVTLAYTIVGRTLTLETDSSEPFEFQLTAVAMDDTGTGLDAQRCIRFEPSCEGEVRVFPSWDLFRDAYITHFGVPEVARPGLIKVAVAPRGTGSRPAGGRRTSR
jgi:hypothetical protein